MAEDFPVRLIARLDIKGANLIKGIHLEGLRRIGDPRHHARRYYEGGIDELLYMDSVASLYGRNNLTSLVAETAAEVFVPVAVGGGVRSVDDARTLLRNGADKVVVNTAAVACPTLIGDIARQFGRQAMVLSVEAKRRADGGWEAYTDNGREHTGLDVVDWVHRGAALGAGEILVTSVDQEGTRRGFDCDLIAAVAAAVPVPVIAAGGMGDPDHLAAVVAAGADAVAMADILHYDRMTVAAVRAAARERGVAVRPPVTAAA